MWSFLHLAMILCRTRLHYINIFSNISCKTSKGLKKKLLFDCIHASQQRQQQVFSKSVRAQSCYERRPAGSRAPRGRRDCRQKRIWLSDSVSDLTPSFLCLPAASVWSRAICPSLSGTVAASLPISEALCVFILFTVGKQSQSWLLLQGEIVKNRKMQSHKVGTDKHKVS